MIKKSHKLLLNDVYSFKLVGISSHENDYRLSWAINIALGIQLAKTNNLVIYNKRTDENQEFSLYRFMDEETLIQYHLIANRCDNGFLIEEMTNIDFLLQITGDVNNQFLTTMIQNLKTSDIITTAFEINPDSLKSKKKLIF